MVNTVDNQILRVVRQYKSELTDKKYNGSFEVIDESSGDKLAHCDLYGQAVFAHIDITDHKGNSWEVRPNRKIMPTQWLLTDPFKKRTFLIKQASFIRLFNPFSRKFLTLLDMTNHRAYELLDLESSIGDRLFGTGPSEWSIVADKKVVAILTRMKKKQQQGEVKKGFFAKFKRLLSGSDWVLISCVEKHLFNAPSLLALLLLFRELSDTSAA